MRTVRRFCYLPFCVLHFALCISFAFAENTEFAVKREQVFEFTEKPSIKWGENNLARITFASKGRCDVAVAIEDAGGRIVRHLAAGCLGPNAPAPLAKDSLRQSITWDGKNDQGKLIEDRAGLSVRVSLGIKPQFERTFFWSPYKRICPGNPLRFASAAEGVYVYEGGGIDHIRLFDHDGNYVRTVYPSSADKLAKIDGLKWMTFPQDGAKGPVWHGLVQATLFTSGDNTRDGTMAKYGTAASALALNKDRLALVKCSLNRFATDGTTAGMKLDGPKTWLPARGREDKIGEGYPRSAAFSPDGKWVYLTGYRGASHLGWLHCVMRMEYLGDKEPELFAGGGTKESDSGVDDAHFRSPMSVACDAQGRVYVADYHNDRIQVFSPEGKLVKSIGGVPKPVNVQVHPKTGDIYVFSWMLVDKFYTSDKETVPATFSHYGPLDNPKKISVLPLELFNYNPTVSWNRYGGIHHDAFVDLLTDPPTVWLVPGAASTTEQLMLLRMTDFGPWTSAHIRLMVEREGKLVEKAGFGEKVATSIVRASPPSAPSLDRQRLYVDPTTGKLYVLEGDSGVGKSVKEVLEIDPRTWKPRPFKLPYTTEEIAFDLDGAMYLRTDTSISRFNAQGWREIPFDYGEERTAPGFDGDGPAVLSVVALPGSGRPGCFHLGGFGLAPNGEMVVSCYNVKGTEIRIPGAFSAKFATGKPYQPPQYPGRVKWGEVHVFDKFGKAVRTDAVGGVPLTDGLAIDREGSIYMLVAANRVIDGTEYPLIRAETLMKFRPGKGRFISGRKDVPVPLDKPLDRKPDLARGWTGSAWVEDVEWMYGGVGFGGFNTGGGCACWNARFALDLFARSFATELNRGTVAMLDSNGNLITRIGRYGNVDEGKPIVPDGGPANPKSVGGDEVTLCHASYVATHTDRRLFIADYGNYRMLSVKLDYHASETIKAVP